MCLGIPKPHSAKTHGYPVRRTGCQNTFEFPDPETAVTYRWFAGVSAKRMRLCDQGSSRSIPQPSWTQIVNQSVAEKLSLERLNALGDAVIAVAMTLLVLNVGIPENHNFSRDGLFKFLASIESDLVIYAACFLLIATYWIEHHALFHHIRCVNRILIWLNFSFLFAITLLPFATKLRRLYPHEEISLAIFGAVHFACALTLFGIWRYAGAHPNLLSGAVEPRIARAINRRLLIGPMVILAAVGLSYVNMRLATWAFLAVPLAWQLERRLDAPASNVDGSQGSLPSG